MTPETTKDDAMLRLLLISSFFLISTTMACRTASDSEATVQSENPSGGASGGSEMSCDDTNATSSADLLNGEQIFALSTRCVFNRETHEVHIRILSETFKKVLDDGCADRDSGFGHVAELIFDGHRIQNVGIKVRGNMSKCNPKRQFKFKFDAKKAFSVWQGRTETKEFPENKGRRFFGLAGYSVRASVNDPSMIRERLSSRVFAHAGSLAPTTLRGPLVYQVSFAKFFVSFNRVQSEGPEGTFTRLKDGYYYDYKGFYSLAENVDEVFLQTRFQVSGQKFKQFSLFQADLGAAQFSRDRYTRKGWSQRFVDGNEPESEAELKAGDAQMFQLFDTLKDSASEADLAQSIDIESVVNYTAAAELTGHWDSMLANRNNDFLFFDGREKKWKIIAWDLDNSMGALHEQYANLMSNSIYHPAERAKSRLFEVIFSDAHPGFKAKLKNRLDAYLRGFYSESELNGTIDWLKGAMMSEIEPWEGVGNQAFTDLKGFANARRDKIRPQLNN
jgi:hypothetical protein